MQRHQDGEALVTACVRRKGNPTYVSWSGMRSRCRPNHPQRQNYFDRGISIAPEWEDFDNFARDMGVRPLHASLDRIDNDKGYSKENCRWATREEQCNNRTSSVLLSFGGETLSVTQWSRRLSISTTALWRRLFVFNWSIEEALTIPKKGSSAWTP